MQQTDDEFAFFRDSYRSELDELFIDFRIVRRPDLVTLQGDHLSKAIQILKSCSQVQAFVLHGRVMDLLLETYLFCANNDQKSLLIELIEWFLSSVAMSRKNFKHLFTHLKNQMYSDQLTVDLVQSFILLQQRIFEERRNLINSPVATFYFNSADSGIVVDTREMRWQFQKGLTLQMWLCANKSPIDCKLLYILSDKKTGCQLTLSQNKVIYQYIDLTKSALEPSISLLEIPNYEWVSFNLQIQASKFFLTGAYYLYLTCNNQQLREIKVCFPNLTYDSQVVELQLCQDFFGQVSSLMLFNEGFDGNSMTCGDQRFGIQSNAHLRTLSKSLDKQCHKMVLCYTPLRSKSNFIIDPISKFDGSLQKHSGTYIRQGSHQQLSQICRLENFIPLLLLLKLCPYPTLLNELLELFCKILKARPDAQQDAVKMELFSLIAIKINEDGLSMINQSTIEVLSQIKNCLHEKRIKEQFVSHLLWRINIYKVENYEIIDDYLKFLRMVYNSNTEFYIKVFGIRQILEILVYDLDPKNRLCCEEHAIQVGYNAFQNPKISYKQQMEAYLNIIEAILFFQFFDSPKSIDYNNVVDIAKVFTLKCSPCFYQILLQRIQKLFYFEKEGNHPISEIFIKQDIMHMLLNLLTTCPCPDVKTSCIKLIAESIRLNNSEDEKKIAYWIAHTLGNSAAVEVISDNEEDDSLEERRPIENKALKFHLSGMLEEIDESQSKPIKQKTEREQVQPRRIIDYEPLYVAIMEWMLRTRVGKTNSDTFLLDETLIIKSEGGLHLLMNYFSYCIDQVKGRIMQDLYMLVKWNVGSAEFLLKSEEFHWWILETLLDMQNEYNNRELNQFEFWIWDCGLKLYSHVLKWAIINEKNGFMRIAQLQAYCKVLEKPLRVLGTQYLIRFILKQLYQFLMECYKMDILSQFWINMYSVIFETFRLTFADPRTFNHQHEFTFQKFHRIANSLTIMDDNLPKKWKQTFGNTQWLDQIYLSNICDVINCYCSKLSPTIMTNLEDFQILQKALQQLLEAKNSSEHQKMFETMLFQYTFGQQKPAYFIQVSQMLLQVGIEYYSLNLQSSEHIKQLSHLLQTNERLFRTFVILAENSREKDIDDDQEKIIYHTMANHFNFLYQLQRRIEEHHQEAEIKKDVIHHITQSIMYSFKFLVIIIDTISGMLGRFDSFQILIFEAHKQQQIPPLKLYAARLLKDLYKENGENLFEVKDSKNLKLDNKRILQKAMQARDVFLETESLLILIESFVFLNEEFYILMRVDFEDVSRIYEQRYKTLHDSRVSLRQKYEETLFKFLESTQLGFTHDQRIQKIDSEQIYLRRARYMFKRAFNRVRVFNQWWTHQDFQVQIDKAFDSQDLEFENINQNKLYGWKMWKYETKQKCRPLLKCKLYEYPEQTTLAQEESGNNSKNNRIMNLLDIDKKTQKIQKKEKETDFLIMPIKQLLFNNTTKEEELVFNRVQWIKTLTVRMGSLRVAEGKLTFYYESINQKETHQSLIKFKVPEDSKLVKDWSLEQIYDISYRRYIGRWTSVEIVFLNGSTLVFNFPQKDHQLLIEKLVGLKKTVCLNLKQRVINMKLDPWSIMQESKALTKWYNYKITNFEYLMKLNKISGRSNKDLTQYPVVPWVMNDGEQFQKYRDLTKSMGNLGNADRIAVFQQRYNMVDHFNKVPQFHYGSHYSSPATIFNYLIRLRPFADGARELQSGKFDLADRLFFSFTETYRNATEELSDVRELIPEFYYMPEMFLNLSKYDYGVQQTGLRVNNVELPSWTRKNPYIFICGHRMEMESDYVSCYLNQWIDLIFGYKQKGEEAVKALNTFYYLTYENSIDWDSITNEKQRISLESQAIHFGQCPSQIFDRPHPVRGKPKQMYRIVDEKALEKVFRQKPIDGSPVSKALVGNFQRNRAIIRIQFLNENKLWLIRRNGEINTVKIGNSSNDIKSFEINWQKESSINMERTAEENAYIFDWTCFYDELPLVNKGKFILVGGVWDGRLLVFGNESEKIIESYDDQDSTITVIRQDYKMKILATGSKNGTLCIYQFTQPKLLKLVAKHHNHEDVILDIFIDQDLKVVLTCSQDGWVHMYNMWSGKYLRSYRHPKGGPILKVATYCTPLYGIVFYENKSLYSYSINGQFLAKYDLPQPVVNQGHLKVVKDSKMNDIIMVPLAQEKKFLFLTSPFLVVRAEIKLTPHLHSMNDITSYALSPERMILAFGTTDGEFGLCTDIRSLQQQ